MQITVGELTTWQCHAFELRADCIILGFHIKLLLVNIYLGNVKLSSQGLTGFILGFYIKLLLVNTYLGGWHNLFVALI